MKWRFWRREAEIYVGGIEICKKSIGSDDRGGGKWCETFLEWPYTRKKKKKKKKIYIYIYI